MIPRQPAKGTIRTWVKSQRKLRPLPGHFSVAINNFINPLGGAGISGWDDAATRLDIDVQTTRMALVMNDGNRRVWSVSGQIDVSHAMAPMIGDSTDSGALYTDSSRRFANWRIYAHILSTRTNTIAQERIEVTGSTADRNVSWNGISALPFTPVGGISGVAYKGASGTNTYLLRQLSDPVRLIGRNASANASVAIAVTNGSSTLPGFRLADSTAGNRGWVMWEIYRDTGTTGSYDKRVLLAGANLDRFVDDGSAINSYAWEAFGPGPIATINNNGLPVRARYADGLIELLNSPIGASTLLGTWTQGDRIWRENIAIDAFGTKKVGAMCRSTGSPGIWDELLVGTGGSASAVWDPPSVAAQIGGVPGTTSTTVTAAGVVLGDTVVAS